MGDPLLNVAASGCFAVFCLRLLFLGVCFQRFAPARHGRVEVFLQIAVAFLFVFFVNLAELPRHNSTISSNTAKQFTNPDAAIP